LLGDPSILDNREKIEEESKEEKHLPNFNEAIEALKLPKPEK
jgi:hypothetical protein